MYNEIFRYLFNKIKCYEGKLSALDPSPGEVPNAYNLSAAADGQSKSKQNM